MALQIFNYIYFIYNVVQLITCSYTNIHIILPWWTSEIDLVEHDTSWLVDLFFLKYWPGWLPLKFCSFPLCWLLFDWQISMLVTVGFIFSKTGVYSLLRKLIEIIWRSLKPTNWCLLIISNIEWRPFKFTLLSLCLLYSTEAEVL